MFTYNFKRVQSTLIVSLLLLILLVGVSILELVRIIEKSGVISLLSISPSSGLTIIPLFR